MLGTALIVHCMVRTCRGSTEELTDAHRVGGAGLDGPKGLPIPLRVLSSALNQCFDPQAGG